MLGLLLLGDYLEKSDMKTGLSSRSFPTARKDRTMKIRSLALSALLGATLSASVLAQPGQGMGPGGGMGPGMGPGGGMGGMGPGGKGMQYRFNKDNTPGWSLMTPEERTAHHDKMMADMKAADARLEALAQTMTSGRGDDKVAAMQAILTELVKNQVDMHRHMAMMHDHMMSQMSHK